MTEIEIIIYILFVVGSSAFLTLCTMPLIHIFQLESYRNQRFWRWFKKNLKVEYIKYCNLAFLCTISLSVCIALFWRYSPYFYLSFLLFGGLSYLFFELSRREKKKVPLKITPRVFRLISAVAVLWLIVAQLSTFFTINTPVRFIPLALLPLLAPFVLMAAACIIYPVERAVNAYYLNKAQKKLARNPQMRVIGITGSFGKTSVKGMLLAMLSTQFKVGASIKSYNTPMGICKMINDDNQELNYDFFIAEMGARQRGDIKELCNLLKPEIAIITGISNQHLETFKTIENIAATKFELVEAIKDSGFSAFNCTLEAARQLYEKDIHSKIAVAQEGQYSNLYASFSNVSCNARGTEFTLRLEENSVEIKTKLLGEANVSNLTLAAAVAYKLGVDAHSIQKAAAELSAEPHRLELIDGGEGQVIIDDAYNSNIDGAENALKVLSLFDGQKIVITPGIVELGKASDEINQRLGRAIGEVAHHLFLIGANSESIKKGASEAGMSQERISLVRSLDEAVAFCAQIQSPKTLLFENDLPDNY